MARFQTGAICGVSQQRLGDVGDDRADHLEDAVDDRADEARDVAQEARRRSGRRSRRCRRCRWSTESSSHAASMSRLIRASVRPLRVELLGDEGEDLAEDVDRLQHRADRRAERART